MTETLRNIDQKSVESSLGWRIDILSIDAFRYVESDRTITFEIEDRPDAGGELDWIVYLPKNWVWKTADNGGPVGPEKIPEILNRISLAFWKLDMKIREVV